MAKQNYKNRQKQTRVMFWHPRAYYCTIVGALIIKLYLAYAKLLPVATC